MALVDLWKGVGLATLIYIAGLAAISPDFYEAARIDGATRRQMFWRITVPLVRPATVTVVTLSLIGGLRLVDYKVRIFQGGTDAVTRVLIESGDETGERWTTVGVSANIIDASFQALVDSITYKLVKAGATA